MSWALSQYGQAPNTFYYDGDMERIHLYFNHKKGQETQLFFLDDITWNDLDMDEIYKTVNNTMTSTGGKEKTGSVSCLADLVFAPTLAFT